MVRYGRAITLLIVLPLILIGCGAKEANSAKGDISGVEKAPDFTLTSLDGKSISLSSFNGKKAVLLDFTTTWCPHCITIIPAIKDIYENYKDKGLEVIAIYVNESRNSVESLVQKHNIPYTVLLDSGGVVASDYEVRGVPTVVVVDKNGTIRYKGHSVPKDIIEQITNSNL